MRTATTKKTTGAQPKAKSVLPSEIGKPKVLDDEASARVLAEYLVLGEVKASEINFIENGKRGLNYREVALTFRVSELLGIRDCFEMGPRFREVFAIVRRLITRGESMEASDKTEVSA
jgi:hypothetical protein